MNCKIILRLIFLSQRYCIYGFLLSQEWYGGIPGFAGMVWGDSWFRRIGNTAFNETGICGGTTTYGFLLSQEWYGGIPGFAGMVRGDPRFRRIGNRAFDDTGIYGGTTTYGFLLSQEWYGGIPGFAGLVTRHSMRQESVAVPPRMDSCFRRNGMGGFLVSQVW